MNKCLPMLFLLASGCLSVADHRVEIDREVGRGGNAELTVEVHDGLATIRALEGRTVRLWANAPTFTVSIGAVTAGDVTLVIENLLPDAAITDDNASPRIPGAVPTEGSWTLRTTAGETSSFTITTADRSDLTPWRFIVFADVQDALEEVDDVYDRMNEADGIRFAIIAGDLTEQGSTEQLERFQFKMKRLGIPAFATLGNHELGASEDNFHKYFGRGTSSFTFRGVRFTLVDSASAMIAPAASEMVDAWLGHPEDRMHIAAMHIPPIDPHGVRNGSFASRAEAARLLGRLAEGGVNRTYYGHIHSFYAFDNAGIPAFITGGGGAIPERLDGIGRHFLIVEIDPIRRDADTALVRVD